MEVMIGLPECRHVDAAAIGLLLDVQRRVSRHGGVLTSGAPSLRTRRIIGTGNGTVPRTSFRQSIVPAVTPAGRTSTKEARE
ncbi:MULTISPECIES: hypothetical protein [Micromonospora]|uniref:hypothetical protein n=1 Tax=Micromonospora TaxID=1873 RepID=UPI00098D5C49|nr:MULTISPECIES: hypothetical protein [unclassified Micromonospora]MDI5937002.1 hypothetical protein [Micromonospora sp. DH15]